MGHALTAIIVIQAAQSNIGSKLHVGVMSQRVARGTRSVVPFQNLQGSNTLRTFSIYQVIAAASLSLTVTFMPLMRMTRQFCAPIRLVVTLRKDLLPDNSRTGETKPQLWASIHHLTALCEVLLSDNSGTGVRIREQSDLTRAMTSGW